MKVLLVVFALFALNHARITIPLNKVRIDPANPQSDFESHAVSVTNTFLNKNPDSMNITLLNARNFFYFGDVYVGSNNLTMKVLFDTGSNDLWLSTPSCYQCPGTTRYDCGKSTTCKRTNDPKSLAYGLGKVSGYMGSDMFGLTPTFRVESPILMVTSGESLANYKNCDGFLGLGSKNNAKDFIDLAYDAGQIDSKIFSIHMDYNQDVTMKEFTNGTYMTIGYVPEDKVNNMAWVPVTVSDRWATDILGVKIGDKILGSSDTSGTVLFDTGCSLNYLLPGVAQEFLAQMKKFNYYMDWSMVYLWPCEEDDLVQYPNITLSVSGLRIDITPASYFDYPSAIMKNGHKYCQQLIQSSPFGMSILGDAFLKENFIAYSKLNQTIGVNLAAGHQVLPNPNPPQFVILIQVALMVLLGLALFINQKKKIQATTKASQVSEDPSNVQPLNSNQVF